MHFRCLLAAGSRAIYSAIWPVQRCLKIAASKLFSYPSFFFLWFNFFLVSFHFISCWNSIKIVHAAQFRRLLAITFILFLLLYYGRLDLLLWFILILLSETTWESKDCLIRAHVLARFETNWLFCLWMSNNAWFEIESADGEWINWFVWVNH